MIEEFTYALMERTWKIMRKSISTFLKHFEYFTTTPVFLMLPFSASILVSQTLLGFSQISLGFSFPSTKSNLSMINKTYFSSQTLFPSILVIPFYLSSFVISKACVIQALKEKYKKPCPQTTFFSCLSLYKPLLITQLYNITFSISINMASMLLISIAFSSLEAFGFFMAMMRTIFGIIFYAVLTNAFVLCNLSTAVAGFENCTAHEAMHKAYLLRKGSNSTAMLLALPTNLGLASLEALFCLRVVRAYHHHNHNALLVGKPTTLSMALEGTLIAYLYSIVLVLDTIACCLFIKSCGIGSPNYLCNRIEIDT